MPRRAPRRPSNRPSATHGRPANHCRALIPVDGSAIRKKIKKDYEQALRDLEKSRRELDRFQQTDLPEFTRWVNGHFGALLTELRELSQKIALDDMLVFQVEDEVMFGGGSYARAYKRVMEFREHPPAPPPGASGNGEPDGHRGSPGGRPEFGDADDEEDASLKELFNKIFGAFGPDESPGENPNPWAGRGNGAAPPPPASERLKDLYRKLVRRLHPDTQEKMTPQKTEWWHQAQAAYNAGDADQLEVILTLCEIGDSGTTAQTSATLLQRITAQLKSSLREIKRQLSQRRKDLAWNFSRREDRDGLASEMRATMTRDLQRMRQHWRETQELIAGWKAAADRLKPSRRRKRQRHNPEFLF